VAGCDDHTVQIWDIATAKRISPRLPHDAALRTAVFAENDSQIITGTSAGTTYVWDVPREPLEADVEWIALWFQIKTGMELDAKAKSTAWTKKRGSGGAKAWMTWAARRID
jgi:WD40 repeat protein